ncbi:MAG TPA: GGDEF domain-containing protein [Thermoanaerobaculaceae bacterium]|nr:GGDEF domain-containing protein [Thermoanaerobaculaceae bacterium]HRS17091.1 GGDEF domain-containing protein [Thermoanaerobaculaceae bacterium]
MVALQAPFAEAVRSLWGDFFSAPEPCLREAAWRNEVVVAQVRLVILSLLCAVPIVQLVVEPGELETWFGLAIVLAALGFGVGIHTLAQHGMARSQLPLLSSLLDATTVSLGLGFFLAIDRPLTATNSFVVFPFYFLAIATSSLRYDPRICLLAGVVASAEYGLIVKLALMMGVADPLHMGEHALTHGNFDLLGQFVRVFVLLAAAFIAAVSVVRSRELLARSARDPLTGLLNRAAFAEMARVELARARRHGGVLAVALLDLDFFKRINDMHGHQVGDRVLAWFGPFMHDAFRESDAVARLGGDEFAVLLGELSIGRSAARIDELRSSLESRAIPETPFVSITVSAGLAAYPDDGETVEALLGVADDRLYEAKASGRNRIVLASGPRTAVILVSEGRLTQAPGVE